MIDGLEATLGIYAATFVVAVLSGFIPVVNAELYLIGVAVVTGNVWLAVVLGVIVAAGQMVAKIGIYQAARSASSLGGRRGPKYEAKLAKARALVDKWRDKPFVLLFVSASTGLPPFFIVSLLAGMLSIKFRPFVTIGMLGRTLRFVTIALVALLF
ncbi:MAG: hypothetical protein AB7O24_22115 [Kofleriaceae bacterium]